MGITKDTKAKAVHMTTVNLITESDAANAITESERKALLSLAASDRVKKLQKRSSDAGFSSFSELVRAFADGKADVVTTRKTGT